MGKIRGRVWQRDTHRSSSVCPDGYRRAPSILRAGHLRVQCASRSGALSAPYAGCTVLTRTRARSTVISAARGVPHSFRLQSDIGDVEEGKAMKYSIFLFLCLTLAALLSACGSGSGGDAIPLPLTGACYRSGWLVIDTPATSPLPWNTTIPEVTLSGSIGEPGVIDSRTCPPGLSYIVGWRNEDSGESGSGQAFSSVTDGVLGPYCRTRWWAPSLVGPGIPLVTGQNRLVVTASRNGTEIGRDCLTVQLQASSPMPTTTATVPANGAAGAPIKKSVSPPGVQ